MTILSRTTFQRVFDRVNTGSATLTAVSPTTGATFAGSSTVSVPGAAIGDIVDVSFPTAPAAGLVMYGTVTASGVVTVYASNVSAGTLATPAGLYRVATYPFTGDVA
jgi:hypothetical protein